MKIIKWVAIAIVPCIVAAGCGRSEQTATPASVAAIAPLKLEELRVVASPAGEDAAPTPLTVRTPIVLRLKVGKVSRNARIEAKLIDLKNGQQAGLATHDALQGDPRTIEMQFVVTNDLTPGRYLVETRLDGQLLAQRDVDLTGPQVR